MATQNGRIPVGLVGVAAIVEEKVRGGMDGEGK